MAIAIPVFIAVFLVVVGAYWLLIGRSESRDQRQLAKRLKASIAKRPARTVVLVREKEQLSAIGPLNSVLLRARRVSGPIERAIEQADVHLTVGTLLLASGCAGLVAWLVVAWYTRLTWLGVLVGLGAAWVPFMIVRRMATRRVLLFEEQFPEAIDLISRALRAGHAFTTGLAMVAEEAPQPVAGEFRVLYDQQNFGMPMPEALRAFARRIPLLDARFFVTAVLTQREAGGNLAEILDNLASVIRGRFTLKRQVRVLTAHARITGWVLAALPPGLALAFMIKSPNHIMTLVNDPLGVQMIVGALALQVLGMVIIQRLVNIKY